MAHHQEELSEWIENCVKESTASVHSGSEGAGLVQLRSKGHRRLSCFTLGQLAILAAFIQHLPLFVCEFVYEQWPRSSWKFQPLA